MMVDYTDSLTVDSQVILYNYPNRLVIQFKNEYTESTLQAAQTKSMTDAAIFKQAVMKLFVKQQPPSKKKLVSSSEGKELEESGDSHNFISLDDYYSRENRPWEPQPKQQKRPNITYTFGQYYTVNLASKGSSGDGTNVFVDLSADIIDLGKKNNMLIYNTTYTFTSCFADEIRQRGEVEALKKAHLLAKKQAKALNIELKKVKAVNPPPMTDARTSIVSYRSQAMMKKGAVQQERSMNNEEDDEQMTNTKIVMSGDLRKVSSTFTARVVFMI